jgi:hypothetical protein
MTHFLLLTFLCARIKISGPGDDEQASMVESPSSAAVAAEVEAAAKEAEVLVEVAAVGRVAVAAEAFLARFFAARFARSFSRVEPQTGGDAVAAGLVPKIFLKPVLNEDMTRKKKHTHSTERESP